MGLPLCRPNAYSAYNCCFLDTSEHFVNSTPLSGIIATDQGNRRGDPLAYLLTFTSNTILE